MKGWNLWVDEIECNSNLEVIMQSFSEEFENVGNHS